MRPVEKGSSDKIYHKYQDARDGLRDRICFYCSYCEMPIYNMAAIEHVVPRKNGGSELDWENFLFSCWYCNSNKGNANSSREGYLWPDKDNTFKAFKYDYNLPPTVADGLTDKQSKYANATIELFKLHRDPSTCTGKWDYGDTRWKSRYEAWQAALDSLKNWEEAPCAAMANQIALTAKGYGHFSIWMEVFKEKQEIRRLFINAFEGTALDCFDENTSPVEREGGAI